ncbi:hypothetical protein HOH87_03935 [bacterium]|jgi:HAD superfamily hydrolase (TIGR01450 family)|nr:hypothetical protein [bacterium]
MTRLSQLVMDQGIQTVLVDASGVLYTDDGVVPGVPETIQSLRDAGCYVIVVTNNSGHSQAMIADRLTRFGIPIDPQDVISSGLGLSEDAQCRQIIEGRSVFVYGRASSHGYVTMAGGQIVDEVGDSEVVVMMASLKADNQAVYESVRAHVIATGVPVVCANPDQYIWNQEGLYKVCGYYATQLEKETSCSMTWIGKPFCNFSMVVHDILMRRNISVDNNVLFIDDNIHNVDRLRSDLGILGGCVSLTGLMNHYGMDIIQIGQNTDYVFETLAGEISTN